MYRKEPWEWGIIAGFAVLFLALSAVVIYAAFKERWEVEASQRTAVPRAEVYSYLTEPDRRVTWQPNLLDMAALTGEIETPGATRMLFMGGDGRRWQEEETQLAFQPPSFWAVHRDGPNAEREIEIRLEAVADGGTELLWQEQVRYKTLEDRLLAPLAIRERRRKLSDALLRLAAITAGGESDYPPGGETP